jgi:hypothetical protein
VECKLRCVNFRNVSDPRRAFLLAYRVTGSAGDKSGSADDKPGSAGDTSGSTSNHSRVVWEKNNFFDNTAGALGNHSYYLPFNHI